MPGDQFDPHKDSVYWGILISFIYAFLGFLFNLFSILKERF